MFILGDGGRNSKYLIIEFYPFFEMIDISPAGDILICDVLDIPLTEIRTKSLKDALNDLVNHSLYRRLKERTRICSGCPEIDFCQAGCYARSFRILDTRKDFSP